MSSESEKTMSGDLVRSEVEAALETAMRGFERIKSSDLTMDGFTTFHGRLSMDEVVAFNDLFAGVFRVASWFVECDNCPGDGVAYVTFEEPCPSCRGRGFRWTPETIERVGSVLCTPDAHALNTYPDGFKKPCVGHYREAEAALWSLFTQEDTSGRS